MADLPYIFFFFFFFFFWGGGGGGGEGRGVNTGCWGKAYVATKIQYRVPHPPPPPATSLGMAPLKYPNLSNVSSAPYTTNVPKSPMKLKFSVKAGFEWTPRTLSISAPERPSNKF